MHQINGRRIILIGGAGFIGHNLALHLKRLGAEVSIYDSLQVNNLLSFTSSEHDSKDTDLYLNIIFQRLSMLRAAKIPLYINDAREYHTLSKVINKIKPQVIIHLAAVSHANKSNKDPFSTFDHSFRTLENALDNANSEVIEHFIYFSSSMVYGHFKSEIVTEDTYCEPVGIYGALKFGGEKLVIAYNQAFGLPYTIIRPSALYGERCVSRRVGQIFIENALQDSEITISGNGDDKLDFTYIQDLIEGVVKIVENKKALNQIFNITYGESRSLAQMTEIIKEHFSSVNIRYVKKDKLTPDRGTLSVEKAKELIGYEPKWPLHKGFPEYIRWYKELFSKTSKPDNIQNVYQMIQNNF